MCSIWGPWTCVFLHGVHKTDVFIRVPQRHIESYWVRRDLYLLMRAMWGLQRQWFYVGSVETMGLCGVCRDYGFMCGHTDYGFMWGLQRLWVYVRPQRLWVYLGSLETMRSRGHVVSQIGKYQSFIEPFAPGGQKAKLHSHTTFLMNKYMSTTNK